MSSLTSPALPSKWSPNAVGAGWMLASACAFVVMAACLKLLALQGFSESQMVFARSAAGFAVIAPVVLFRGRHALAVARPAQVLWRCAASTVGFFAGFYAFMHLPLADAQAITFTRVLFVVIFAAVILKEKVAWRRWSAVGVGFAGVLLMLRPEAAGFSLATIAALVSALFFSVGIVLVKDLTKDHSTIALLFYSNLFTTLAGLPFAFHGWIAPNLVQLALLLLLGVAGVAAQSAYIRALTFGEASLMGLIDYIRLPMAIVLGLVLFHEAPDLVSVAGAGVIIASTVYITWREARLKT